MARTNAAINDPGAGSDVNQAPRHSDGSICTPKALRFRRTGSSRWNQITRPESESFDAVPSSSSVVSSPLAVVEPIVSSSSSSLLTSPSEDGVALNNNAGKKTAWNKPPNGASDVGLVMGGVSWPASSASTRAASTSSSELQKGLPDGYDVFESQKQISSNVAADSSTIANHSVPARQKTTKRNSANNSYSGGISQQSIFRDSSGESLSYYSNSKDHNQRSGLGTQSLTSNDYPIQPKTSLRNRNGGTHLRGDSSHHNNHVVRRDHDHDRGNQGWNGHGNFNGRQERIFPRHMRPSPPTVPFIPPPSIRPFVGQVPFPELAASVIYVDPHRGIPFVAPIAHPAIFFQAPDPHLFSKIVNQIDYYFSNENLIKDTFLRQNMDDQGWVPVKLIAGFNKVLCLTDNMQLILDALRASTVVEVQGDKARRRNDWMRWTMPHSSQISNIYVPRNLEAASGSDFLTTCVQNLASEIKSNYNGPKFLGDQSESLQGKSPEELGRSPVGDSGFNHSSSARN